MNMSFKKIDSQDSLQPEGKKALLIYGYNNEEINQIKEYGAAFNIESYIDVPKEKCGYTLEELLENPSESKMYGGAVLRKSIILNAFSGQDTQNFINGFKESGVPRPIFAVVTEHSKKWQLGKLVKELILESQMMGKKGPRKHK